MIMLSIKRGMGIINATPRNLSAMTGLRVHRVVHDMRTITRAYDPEMLSGSRGYGTDSFGETPQKRKQDAAAYELNITYIMHHVVSPTHGTPVNSLLQDLNKYKRQLGLHCFLSRLLFPHSCWCPRGAVAQDTF